MIGDGGTRGGGGGQRRRGGGAERTNGVRMYEKRTEAAALSLSVLRATYSHSTGGTAGGAPSSHRHDGISLVLARTPPDTHDEQQRCRARISLTLLFFPFITPLSLSLSLSLSL